MSSMILCVTSTSQISSNSIWLSANSQIEGLYVEPVVITATFRLFALIVLSKGVMSLSLDMMKNSSILLLEYMDDKTSMVIFKSA